MVKTKTIRPKREPGKAPRGRVPREGTLARDWFDRGVEMALQMTDLGTENRRLRDNAATVLRLLELGDGRLLASDGPAGGRLPQLSPEEWDKVYRACKAMAAER